MATASPINVTMFRAYCETAVTRLSRNVPARPPTMVQIPIPSGRPAATTVPKMISSRISVTGNVTVSARVRSLSSVVLKSRLIGTFPVPTTVRPLGRTAARSAV